ncbi:hypothetical protein YTPLAS18_04590 [Nitrospira sp.]|nr:hypothetical protein YTPLAS18_04590 [Nitrospira sp.]
MSVSLDVKQQGVSRCVRSSSQEPVLGLRRSVLLTPLYVMALWFMWQKGCVPKEDVLPTAAVTAHAAGLAWSWDTTTGDRGRPAVAREREARFETALGDETQPE